MPLASNFLVPNGTFIVVLIAFILVVTVITKYVLPPLNKVLSERQEQIRGELEAADKAKADAEEADTERRAALEQARTQPRQAAVEEVTARVGEIVLAAAERVIGREINLADHQDLIDEAIAAVRAETSGVATGGAR